jgi:Thioredoxin reductase
MKQLVIIGGGPAGISASIYAVRKKMDFVLITKEVGGQVIKAGNIENYLGYAMVDGIILVEKMMEHMRKLGVEPILDEVVDVERLSEGFEVRTASGQSFKTKTILFCTGAEYRKLNVPGEKEYIGRGISYCYTCDAPFFKNKKVAVVGGGNSGFEAAEQLLNYASTIYLLEISDQFMADEVLREKVLGNEKVIPLLRHRVVSAEGDGMFLKAIVVEDLEKWQNLPVGCGGTLCRNRTGA